MLHCNWNRLFFRIGRYWVWCGQKKGDATGSVTAIESEEFNKGVLSSPADLIAGKSCRSPDQFKKVVHPGTSNTIKIRGGSSLRQAIHPLYVIDGIPMIQ